MGTRNIRLALMEQGVVLGLHSGGMRRTVIVKCLTNKLQTNALGLETNKTRGIIPSTIRGIVEHTDENENISFIEAPTPTPSRQ